MTAIPFVLITLASAGATPNGVVLDFMAPWCGPCMQMNPVVEKLHREGYPIQQVNIDEHRDIAERYHVTTIPAFVLVVEGQEVNRIVGATTESQLKRLLAQIPAETQVAKSDEAKPSQAKAATERKKSRSVSAQLTSNPEKKGFELPFFKKKGQKANVIVEPETSNEAVVRANNDDKPQARTAGTPLASTVRIRVRDNGGVNFGTGTIIDSQPGKSLILTCGHIFRAIEEGASVEVDVYRENKLETFTGSVVKYDLEAEVGIVSIDSDNVLPVCKVAAADAAPAQGDRVTSIGCSSGEPPSVQHLLITELNKYRGPDNVECTGLPVQGRSGGGLFNRKGEVIGVCFAADPKEDRGLYSGLQPVRKLLAACGLSGNEEPHREPSDVREHAAIAASHGEAEPSLRESSARTEFADLAAAEPIDVEQPADAQGADADMEEAEIVCIIRPLKRPQDASRVVIINRASSKFVKYLKGEMQSQPQQTMARVPNADVRRERPTERTLAESNDGRPSAMPMMRVVNRPTTDVEQSSVSADEVPHRYRRSQETRQR